MNGFDQEGVECGGPGEPRCPIKNPMYSYVPRSESKPYFDMASQYVLADRMFVSNVDESSFVSHQYIIAGQASSSMNVPEGGPWGCSGSAVVMTITQLRARRAVRFRHASITRRSATSSMRRRFRGSTIRPRSTTETAASGAPIKRSITSIMGRTGRRTSFNPQTRFFKDVRNGRLPAVSWVTPTCKNSDHAGCDADDGPKWVSALVNAVGESKYWKTQRHLRLLGRSGRLVRPCRAEKARLRRARFPRSAAGHLALCQARARLPRALRARQPAALRRGSLRPGDPRGIRRARNLSGRPTVLTSCEAPRKFVPIPTTMSARDFEREPLDPRPVDTE